MKTRILLSSVLLSAMTWLSLPATALAGEGVVLAPSALGATYRSSLTAEIAKARAANPGAFDNLARLRADLSRLDANKRGRYVPVARMLRPFGRDALLPMLEQLAVDATPRGTLTDTAWAAWRAGLVESVGALRDPRSAPVLLAILQSQQSDFMLLRAAASAYGKLGTDDVTKNLISLSRVKSPKQQAILAGMGACRRAAIATELARVLSNKPGAETARLVARSLGDVGSAWAWQTSAVAANGEGPKTREIAAHALMQAFVTYDGDVRTMASKALMVVNDPSTPALVSTARAGASPELLVALDALEQLLASNPIR